MVCGVRPTEGGQQKDQLLMTDQPRSVITERKAAIWSTGGAGIDFPRLNQSLDLSNGDAGMVVDPFDG